MASDVILKQENGEAPRVLQAYGNGGEASLGIFCFQFTDQAYFDAVSDHHLVILHLHAPVPVSCRVGNQTLDHIAQTGNVTICPAGAEASARSAVGLKGLMLMIPQDPLALKSAELIHAKASLSIKLEGIDDTLLAIARELFEETAGSFTSGALHWHQLTEELIEHIFLEYCTPEYSRQRGVLAPDMLARINQYILAHLAEPIDVDTLADVACRGRWQFPRIFRRSVGMSPYQYIIQLRLKRALQDIKAGEMSLAEIALANGFVDQSHLNRWTRRIHGISPGQLTNERNRPVLQNSRILQSTYLA